MLSNQTYTSGQIHVNRHMSNIQALSRICVMTTSSVEVVVLSVNPVISSVVLWHLLSAIQQAQLRSRQATSSPSARTSPG